MTVNIPELLKCLVIGYKRVGRRRNDKQVKQKLVRARLQAGVSFANLAYERGAMPICCAHGFSVGTNTFSPSDLSC